MKKTIIGLMGLMGLMGLWACEKESEVQRAESVHNIFYTVAENAGYPDFSGTTVHLTTEAEWEALLEDFCDYAQSGEQVTFTSLSPTPATKANSDLPTSISTTDREELKTWMKEMEKAGKTVNVTYDNGTGTWNGRAYANISPQEPGGEVLDFSGTIAFIPTPVLDNPPLGGLVMALQVPDGNTYIISMHGMMMWFDTETPDEDMELFQGAQATLTGVASSHTDLNGNTFYSVELLVTEECTISF